MYHRLWRSFRHQRTYCRQRGLDLDLALALARVLKGIREGVARELRGSQAVVPMRLARVRARVAEGARLWSERTDGVAGPAREWRWRQRRRLLVLLYGHHNTANTPI